MALATPKRLDVADIRRQFPGLRRSVAGRPAVFLDGPAGSQVPTRVIDAVRDYFARTNANTHGAFATSMESDEVLAKAAAAVADLLGTNEPELIAFGPNMTTLTFSLSRALAQTWRSADEVVVTRLDHDANISPWVLAARDAGAKVRWVEIRKADCTLDLDDLRRQLGERTRLVAVGAASNAVGTLNPIPEIARLVHSVGAQLFVDAVHYAPHALIDVDAWGCDFLACSAYKFFGPHVGILWGRRKWMEVLPAYRVRPAGDELPGRWMTGTQNHEGIAGTGAAIEYLADIGRLLSPEVPNRRQALAAAFETIVPYEQGLCQRLIQGLSGLGGVRVLGISQPERATERAPTVSFVHETLPAAEIAARLGREGIFVWDGNFYALEVSRALGLEPDGMVRVGMLHYNTEGEIDRLLESLGALLP